MNKTKTSTAIVISNNGISNADQELSHTLLNNYLNLLLEEELMPNAILFYGEGVKVLVEHSPFIETIKKLEIKGVKLIACKTCLNFYGIADKLQVGNIGTMTDILHYQWQVEKVIAL